MSRLEQLQKLVMIEPTDPLAHYGVGLELINLGRWDEAAQAFADAIGCDANYSAAFYHRARAQQSGGHAADAKSTLEQGITVAHQQGDMKTVGEMQELLASIAD